MKPALVEVPVAIQAFVRPDMLRKQWEVIKQARPSVLFIRSDGPRDDVSTDLERIKESRKITEDIDWECSVTRFYFEKNQGMYGISEKTMPRIWDAVDRCIFLEDDQVPSVSFFRFCAELLEKYKEDLRFYCITGVNLCERWDCGPYDYLFARVPASSGVAIWRRSFTNRDYDYRYAKNEYNKSLLYGQLPWYLKKQFSSFARNGLFANHKPAGEFFVRVAEYCQNQLVIIPKCNLISNIGVGEGSTHTAQKMSSMPKSMRKLYGMKTYELNFPLTHPDMVISDRKFERRREKQLGVYSRTQKCLRTVERIIRTCFNGEWERVVRGIRKRLKGTIEK